MRPPAILAHRGASGLRPEHTRAAYAIAIDQGADLLEPDVVSTADGILVVRHENEIGGTTDVADHSELAERRTNKVVDGVERSGWFTEDLTLAELKTLRAVERLPDLRGTAYDGQEEVLTLEEVAALAAASGVGLCVEIKHATYFAGLGLPQEEGVLRVLSEHEMDDPRTIIESMETANLRALRGRTRARLGQLFMASGQPYDLTAGGDPRTYADLTSPVQLREVATYADLVGVEKPLVLPVEGGRLASPTSLVADAHEVGLDVVVWTLRSENRFLPAGLRRGEDPAAHGDAAEEVERFLDAGVDGLFMDDPGLGVRVRDRWCEARD